MVPDLMEAARSSRLGFIGISPTDHGIFCFPVSIFTHPLTPALEWSCSFLYINKPNLGL
jgi:hypothetical protein